MKPVVSFVVGRDAASRLRQAFDSASLSLTIGAEEELVLVRPGGGDLASDVDEVLARTSGDPRFVAELRACQIEIVSRTCVTAADLGRELAAARCDLADALAGDLDAVAVGTHPTADTFGPITDGERYRSIAADYPWAARNMLTCGLHVHVGVAGGDRALAVYNALRSYLPELCALAANSPYHHSCDTGVASVRTYLTASLPRSGAPPAFRSWGEFARYVAWGARGGCIPDPTYQWWALRLHPGLGTLEIRVSDAQTEIEDAVSLVALSQALVASLLDRYDSGERLRVHASHLINENLWLAARDATGGWLLDLETGLREPAAERIDRLLDEVAPYAQALGCEGELERVSALAWFGGAARQRALVAEYGIDALPVLLGRLTEESARRVRAQAAMPPSAERGAPGRSAVAAS